MEEITLTFKYAQDEYVKAERQYLFANKTITKTNIAVLSLCLTLATAYLFLSSFSAASIVILATLLIMAIIISFLYFYIPILKFRDSAKHQEEYALTFSKGGIKFKTPSIDSDLMWDIYSALWESDSFYFLIQASRTYTIIPKRAFESLADMRVFEDMALSNLKAAKRSL